MASHTYSDDDDDDGDDDDEEENVLQAGFFLNGKFRATGEVHIFMCT